MLYISVNCGWLGNLDSNQDKQSQSLSSDIEIVG